MGELAKTILLVEDEALIALQERKQLNAAGYEVVHVLSGEEAIRVVEDSPGRLDLILMDIDLGKGMDGTEAARRILAAHDIPVQFLSSHSEPEIVRRTEEITNYGYVVKASSFPVLDASIKMALKLFAMKKQLDLDGMELESANERLRSNVESLEQANELLVESEEQYLSLVDLIPDGAVIFTDGIVQLVNAATVQLFGARDERELLGRDYLGLVAPEFREVAKERTALVLSLTRSAVPQREVEFLRVDGSRFQAQSHGMGISFNNRRSALVIIRSLTERQKAVEKERELLGLYSDMFHKSRSVNLLIDPDDGRIIDANEAAVRFYGFGRQTLLSMRVADINTLPPEAVRSEMSSASAGERSYFSFRHRLADLSERDVEVYSSPIEYGGRRLLYSIIHDVTERKYLDDALRRSKELYQGLLDSMSEGFSVMDAESRFLMANPAAEGLWGCAAGALVGRSAFDFLDEEAKETLRGIIERRKRGETTEYVLPITAADGKRRKLRVIGMPIHDAAGNFRGSSVYFVDVTEQLRKEEELRRYAEDQQTLMMELKHRVKNSLSIIASLMSLALDEIADPASRVVMADMQSRVRSIMAIYEQLYLLERVDKVDFGAYVEALSSSLLATFLERPSNVRLELDLMRVEIGTKDSIALGLIINELLTNSLKYAFPDKRDGTIRIALRERDGEIVLTVSDDGIGIREELLERSQTMGMNLIRLLAKQLGGDARFEAGPGTTFRISFKR